MDKRHRPILMKKCLSAIICMTVTITSLSLGSIKAEAAPSLNLDEYCMTTGIHYNYLTPLQKLQYDNYLNNKGILPGETDKTEAQIYHGRGALLAYGLDHPATDYTASDETVIATLNAAKTMAEGATGSAHEKVLYLHDKLCENVTYSNTRNPDESTAYGALVSKKAICSGISLAFKLLCDFCDIPCMILHGSIWSGGHAWNMVQLEDGEWYEIDCTFDDTASTEIVHKWFLITTAQMNADHTRYTTSNPYSKYDIDKAPIANGTTYAYKTEEEAAQEEQTQEEQTQEEQTQEETEAIIEVTKHGITYSCNTETKEAILTGTPATGTRAKTTTLLIPDYMSWQGSKYRITAISDCAFKNNRSLKQAEISKYVKTIGKEAFMNCKNLKKIRFYGYVPDIGKKSFKGISKKATVLAPKKYMKNYYRKSLKKTGKIPNTTKYKES